MVEERGPTLLIDNQVLISGEVPRVTGFETGLPIRDLGVERFVPGHCTGWKATHRLAAALPDAFIQPSVGTVLRF